MDVEKETTEVLRRSWTRAVLLAEEDLDRGEAFLSQFSESMIPDISLTGIVY